MFLCKVSAGMNQIINFFVEEKRTQSRSLKNYREKFIYVVVFLAGLLTFVMSFVRLSAGEYILGVADGLMAVLAFSMIYLIKIKPYYTRIVVKLFVISFFVFIFIVMYKTTYEARIALPFIFVSAAIFLQGKKAGFIWFMTIVATSLLLYFFTPFWNNFGDKTMMMTLYFLLGNYMILLLYENQQEENSAQLQALNASLDQTVQSRTKELKAQKEAFETLYNKSSDGVLLIQNGHFVDCNEAVVKMLKYDSKEIFLNKHPSKLSPQFQADGKPSSQKADEMMQKCLNEGTHSFEWIHQKADGKNFWCEIVLTKLMLQGEETIHVVWRDISNRKALEKDIKDQAKALEEFNMTLEEKVKVQVSKIQESLDNFEILIDSTIEGIVVYDEDQYIIECNKVCTDLFCSEKEDIIGKRIFDFIAEDDLHLVKEKMQLERAEPYELRVVDSMGKRVPVLISGANLHYNAKPVRVVTIFDLTELKQKDKLLQMQSRHAVMGEMIGMIAHQWRQPLAAISANAGNLSLDVMMEQYDQAHFQTQISKISEQTQFLSTTIDDFRNFFKDKKIKNYTTMREMAESSLKIIKSSLESNQVKIVTNFDTEEEIFTYDNELKQVLLNLFKNAQDALVEKNVEDPEILIKAYSDKAYEVLEISDNAGGIPEGIIDQVFEPYFTTKEKRDGTGLGLYMSKIIVEEHCGGEISVLNCTLGARFKIKIARSKCD